MLPMEGMIHKEEERNGISCGQEVNKCSLVAGGWGHL